MKYKPLSKDKKAPVSINRYWRFMVHENISKKRPPIKKQNLSKNAKQKDDNIKINIQAATQNWNYCIFQIHWNMLEWVNPRSRISIKKLYSISSKKYYIDRYDRRDHWIGHSKLQTLGYSKSFDQKNIIDELEGSLTGAPIYAKNTEVQAVYVEANDDDDDITAGAKFSRINKSRNYM